MNSMRKDRRHQKNNHLLRAVNRLKEDLRSFIALSLREKEASWEQWLSTVKKDVKIRCWERKKCGKTDCPAYKNSCPRCWLVAGTICGDKPIGKFAQKYKSCIECDVYLDEVLSDPMAEVYEHLITLVYSLRNSRIELKSMALHDALTGLYNRNYFDLIVEREIKRIKRYGGAFTIFMIDIDNFKSINDTYGHAHGDGVLKEFARMLKQSIRETDILFRYGGDEFLLLTHDGSNADGRLMISRIERMFAAWNKTYRSEDYELSFSYGSAVFEKNKDFKKVIEQADAEMYKNKQSKRKRGGLRKRSVNSVRTSRTART